MIAKTKRILITGGNGYVGREVTRLLYDQHQVCVADCPGADISAIRRLFGWEPVRSIDDALVEFWYNPKFAVELTEKNIRDEGALWESRR